MKSLNFVNSFDPYAARLEESKRRRRRCALVAAFSVVVLVIVAVAVGFGIRSSSRASRARAARSSSLSRVCELVAYPASCISSFSAFPDASGAAPPTLALLGMRAARREINASLPILATTSHRLDAVANLTVMDALADCSDNLLDSMDLLDQSMAELDQLILRNKSARTTTRELWIAMENIHTWLSAALTFHTSCSDAIQPHPELVALQARGEYVQETLTNSLSLFVTFKRSISSNQTKNRRKLLALRDPHSHLHDLDLDLDLDDDGFPDWLIPQSRKLLQDSSWATSDPSASANAVVARDGRGQFVSIQEAIDAAPLASARIHMIYIKAGIYDEAVVVPKAATNIALLGDGIDRTIIRGRRSVAGGSTTFSSATLAINGRGFVGSHFSVRNSAGSKAGSAVAARVSGDQAAFYRCSFNGFQDTLLAHSSRHFYRECVVSGAVDFVSGNAAAVFQRCNLELLPSDRAYGSTTVSAQGRVTPLQNTGFSFHACRVERGSSPSLLWSRAFLGRPAKDFATTVFMQSEIGRIIHPEGWCRWDGALPQRDTTVFFGEYLNVGPGSAIAARVNWSTPAMTTEQARGFTVAYLISGLDWLPRSGIVFTNELQV